MASDSEYVCTLDEASLEKAKKELHEDPKNRMGAVETLRTWIQQQPHFICRADTPYLLRCLRYCKFSQLETRKRLEKYLSVMNKKPDWMANIDVYDPKIVNFLKGGYFAPLPGRDREGRRVLLIRMASFEPKTTKAQDMFRSCMSILHFLLRDENTFVNGLVFLVDMSRVELKHQTFFSLETIKTNADLMQNGFPARLKGFNYYNMGTIAEALLQLFIPFLKKKLRDRFILHGDNLESVYRVVPMEMMPVEYLPDEYTGKNAGTVSSLVDSLIETLQETEMARYIADVTNPANYNLDESKRPQKSDEPQASFRKLNIE